MTNKDQSDFFSSEILGVTLSGLEHGLTEVQRWKSISLKLKLTSNLSQRMSNSKWVEMMVHS